jgi:hypothetical protein
MRVFPGIMLASLSAISYEVALSRVFSVSLWHHFAFMVISIAMLGIGMSGTVASMHPKMKEKEWIPYYGISLGIFIPLSYLASNSIPFDPVRLSFDRLQLLYICLYYISLSVPFFFFGLIIAASFSSFREKSGSVYGSDLLGAGAGSLLIIFLMGSAGPERSIFIISTAAFAGSFITGGRPVKAASAVLAFAAALIAILNPQFISLRMSPYKGLEAARRSSGYEHIGSYLSSYARLDAFKSPIVRFAPGLSLRYLDPLPEQMGISVDGDDITAITDAGGKNLRFLEFLPSALPYEIARKQDVLILEPKAGLPVLLAKHYGAENILKVESNPLMIDAINKNFGRFSGNIYEKNTWKGLGRSRLKGWDKRFDIIDISLMGTSPSGGFGISENYGLTVEAFGEYINGLKPDGLLSVNLFIIPPSRVELRLLNTAVNVLREKEAGKHIAAIRSWGSICMLIKKSPFTPGEIKKIRDFSEKNRFDIIYYEGVEKEDTQKYIKTLKSMPSYYEAFEKIINPATRDSFVNGYLFDIGEVHDENPFFHYYLKFKNIKEIYALMGRKWQYFIEEGYLLPAIFLQALLISILLLALPALKGPGIEAKKSLAGLSYFAFLGIGFMFVEIPIIQKLILPLEHPAYAFAAALTSILISSGIGSLLGERYDFLKKRYVPAIISAIIIIYGLLMPPVIAFISPYPLWVKVFFSFLIILPLGFFMGLPFPAGMRSIGDSLVPWAWAVNGCFSVLSPAAAMMIALSFGFGAVLFIAAGMYLLAYLVSGRLFEPRPS